jgi:hypothetical protein
VILLVWRFVYFGGNGGGTGIFLKGSSPKLFGPRVPFIKPHSISAHNPPMQGIKLINIHHADLSRSCHLLICTMIATISNGKIAMPETICVLSESLADSDINPRMINKPYILPMNAQYTERGNLPVVVKKSRIETDFFITFFCP